jgi:hypothetical protein
MVTFLVIFQFLTMFNTIVGAGAVKAEAVRAGAVRTEAALRYGSGSDQIMRLPAAPAPQHCFSANLTVGN